MKILILNPNQIARWNPGHQQFRDAIGNFHDCRYYGPKYADYNNNGIGDRNHLQNILKYYTHTENWVPDAILTYGYKYSVPFKGLGETKIPKIHILCDYTPPIPNWPGTIKNYWPMLQDHNYDIFFAMSYQVIKWFNSNYAKKPIFFLPFGVDATWCRPMENVSVTSNVYIGWSSHDVVYPIRRELERRFKEEFEGVKIGRKFHDAFVREMNAAYLNPNTSNAFNTMNMKTFEVMACNRVLLTEWTDELEDIGFRHGVHYLGYHTVEECIDFAHLLLADPKYMASVAKRGYELTLQKHTNDHRVVEMTGRINETI